MKNIIAVSPETKYVVSNTAGENGTAIDTFLSVPSDLINALPDLVEGTQSNQRTGQKINHVYARVHFSFSINDAYASSANWAVRLYMLTSKQAKAYRLIQQLQSSTLLDVGNQSTIDWAPASMNVVQLSMMPLSKEDFSGKWKDFYFSKNSGKMNGDASTPPPSPNGGHYGTHHRFTWNIKHKGALKYDDTNVSGQCTNFAPVWALVAYPLDGTNVTQDPFVTAPINYNVRTEMYFKDP